MSVRLGVLLSAVRSVCLSGCPTFFFRSGSVSVCLFGGGVVRCPLSLSVCLVVRDPALGCPLSVCLSSCLVSFFFLVGGLLLWGLACPLSAVAVRLSACRDRLSMQSATSLPHANAATAYCCEQQRHHRRSRRARVGCRPLGWQRRRNTLARARAHCVGVLLQCSLHRVCVSSDSLERVESALA